MKPIFKTTQRHSEKWLDLFGMTCELSKSFRNWLVIRSSGFQSTTRNLIVKKYAERNCFGNIFLVFNQSLAKFATRGCVTEKSPTNVIKHEYKFSVKVLHIKTFYNNLLSFLPYIKTKKRKVSKSNMFKHFEIVTK